MLTLQNLIIAGVGPTQARQFLDPLNNTFAKYQINNKLRQAAFLAQALYESNYFVDLEENLYYSTPARIFQVFRSKFSSVEEAAAYAKNPQKLANRVYSNRYGNGDEASGDGWKYRGRGIHQLTFKDNYHEASIGLGVDLVLNPEKLSEPQTTCDAFGVYWNNRKCSVPADKGDINAVTKAINPAMEGADKRAAIYNRLMKII